MSENLFGLGAHESSKDERDHKDENLTYAFPFPTVYKTDIDILVPNNLKNQKLIGACTASLTYYVEYLYWKKTGVYTKLSMAFLYLITKRYIDKNMDEGSSLRSALKAAQKYGVCTEATFPSNFDQSYLQFVYQDIPQAAMEEALNYRIGEYKSIPIEPSLLAAAIYKYGMLYARVVIGTEWWQPSSLPKDIDPLRKPAKPISGHAIHLFGYDDSGDKTRKFLINTWGRLWNNNGTGSLIYEDYVPDLTEAWIATLDEVGPAIEDHSSWIGDSVWRALLSILKKFV